MKLTLLTFLAISLSSCSPSMQDIHDQVAADTVQGYELSKKGGDKVEICVKAGIVAATFNQAKNETEYLKWKEIEKADCASAGVPK